MPVKLLSLLQDMSSSQATKHLDSYSGLLGGWFRNPGHLTNVCVSVPRLYVSTLDVSSSKRVLPSSQFRMDYIHPVCLSSVSVSVSVSFPPFPLSLAPSFSFGRGGSTHDGKENILLACGRCMQDETAERRQREADKGFVLCSNIRICIFA